MRDLSTAQWKLLLSLGKGTGSVWRRFEPQQVMSAQALSRLGLINTAYSYGAISDNAKICLTETGRILRNNKLKLLAMEESFEVDVTEHLEGGEEEEHF